MVDDEKLDRDLGGLELEAKLLLDSSEDGSLVGIRGRIALIRCPLHGEVISTHEAGLVDDHASRAEVR